MAVIPPDAQKRMSFWRGLHAAVYPAYIYPRYHPIIHFLPLQNFLDYTKTKLNASKIKGCACCAIKGKTDLKKMMIIFGFITLMPLIGKADIIFFKDGMKTVCQNRAWEENKEVKCEYEGTILSYLKEDVLRIEKIKVKESVDSPAVPTPKKTSPKAVAKPATGPSEKKPPASRPKPVIGNDLKSVANQNVSASNSQTLEFYNPRRTHQYWTSKISKHKVFKEAIAALSKQYDRSPEWIQQHMGETNDLAQIHQNLARNKIDSPVEVKADTVQPVPETLFYNPRRPHKYWTSATSKHNTFSQAVSALAKEYGHSPQWVQQHMGDSNNLDTIHQNLRNHQLSETSP